MDKAQQAKDKFITDICELCNHAIYSWDEVMNNIGEKGKEQRIREKNHDISMINLCEFMIKSGIMLGVESAFETKSESKRKKSMKKG